jgi:hypothetical protein
MPHTVQRWSPLRQMAWRNARDAQDTGLLRRWTTVQEQNKNTRIKAQHGTLSMYKRQRCRCAACVMANDIHNFKNRLIRAGKVPADY